MVWGDFLDINLLIMIVGEWILGRGFGVYDLVLMGGNLLLEHLINIFMVGSPLSPCCLKGDGVIPSILYVGG